MTKENPKSDPIENAIGDRTKPQIPQIPQSPSEIPDVPSQSEMLALEELNRQTEERLQDQWPENQESGIILPEEPNLGDKLTTTATAPTKIPVSKPDPQPVTETSSQEFQPPQKIEIFVDGSIRDGGKRAAIGCVIKKNGITIDTISKEIGPATSNEAEYHAFITAAEYARSLKLHLYPLFIFSDSELLVKQLNGIYRVKSETLQPLYVKARRLQETLNANVRYVPREQNKEADRLANNAYGQVPPQEPTVFDNHKKLIPAEDKELTALKKYVLEDGFVLETVSFHIVTLCAEPLMTPSTTTWDFADRALIPDMVLALLRQPGYLEGIWPRLEIVMGTNKGNSAWCAGIATTIAFFDIIRTLPTVKEMKND